MPYTLANRERLIRVEARIEVLEKRIDALEKRIDGLERQIDARFTGIERQLDALYSLFIGLFSGFVALVVGAMGLIWWVVQDRRRILRPIEDSVEQHRRLVAALIRRAPSNPEIASLLEESRLPPTKPKISPPLPHQRKTLSWRTMLPAVMGPEPVMGGAANARLQSLHI